MYIRLIGGVDKHQSNITPTMHSLIVDTAFKIKKWYKLSNNCMERNRRKLSLQFGGVEKHQSINIINKLMFETK